MEPIVLLIAVSTIGVGAICYFLGNQDGMRVGRESQLRTLNKLNRDLDEMLILTEGMKSKHEEWLTKTDAKVEPPVVTEPEVVFINPKDGTKFDETPAAKEAFDKWSSVEDEFNKDFPWVPTPQKEKPKGSKKKKGRK